MKLKRITMFILAAALACSVCGCGNGNDNPGDGGGKKEEHFTNAGSEYVEALTDTDFSQGFNIYGVDSRYHATNPWATFDTVEGNTVDPVWHISQWGCFTNYFLDGERWKRGYDSHEGNEHYVYPATEMNYKRESDGFVSISNPTSHISVNPSTGSVKLYCDAREEYGATPAYCSFPRISAPRAERQAWPHLLIEQSIAGSVSLADISAAYFDMGFTMKVCEDYTEPKVASRHTAQFQWIICVQCCNSSLDAYGEAFWFNIPIVDARDGTCEYRTQASSGLDSGKDDSTGNMIYSVSNYDYTGGAVSLDKKYELSVDMYGKITEAFGSLKKSGRLNGCELSDMRIFSTNIGWELPGTYNVGVDIDYVSLKYVMQNH